MTKMPILMGVGMGMGMMQKIVGRSTWSQPAVAARRLTVATPEKPRTAIGRRNKKMKMKKEKEKEKTRKTNMNNRNKNRNRRTDTARWRLESPVTLTQWCCGGTLTGGWGWCTAWSGGGRGL